MFLHYLAKHGNMKTAPFHALRCCITTLPEFNRSLLDFFTNCVDLQLLLYNCLNFVINRVQLWVAAQDHSSGEMKLGVSRCSSWWNTYLTAVNILEIVRYHTNTVQWLSFQARRRTALFLASWLTSVVIDGRRLCSSFLSSFMYTINHFVNEWRSRCDQVIIWMWHSVFAVKAS